MLKRKKEVPKKGEKRRANQEEKNDKHLIKTMPCGSPTNRRA